MARPDPTVLCKYYADKDNPNVPLANQDRVLTAGDLNFAGPSLAVKSNSCKLPFSLSDKPTLVAGQTTATVSVSVNEEYSVIPVENPATQEENFYIC